MTDEEVENWKRKKKERIMNLDMQISTTSLYRQVEMLSKQLVNEGNAGLLLSFRETQGDLAM